ncbi:hypothetical protein NIES4074_38230 [Cylindrospermum sp. NIES-4074]|nr:hypothetical protein NIES4074_38230 [Cylindrospermum sp. NIES-4074]
MSQEWGVGGRVWGVGEEEKRGIGEQEERDKGEIFFLFPTPHTPHPTPHTPHPTPYSPHPLCLAMLKGR